MRNRKNGIVLSVLLSLFLSACATVQVPDIPVCTEFDLDRGRCTMSVSDVDINIDEEHTYMGKTWWELRPSMVYLPYPAWVELKTFAIKMCKKNAAMCDAKVKSWDRKFNYIDENVKKKGATLTPLKP